MVKSGNKRRTGIFGGTFNPVHFGHLIPLEFARDSLGLDRIILVPAGNPVHKKVGGDVEPEDRLAMVELAVSSNPFFEVSTLELDRAGGSYTITTIEKMRESYPDDELFLIIGSDSFNELDTWKSYKDILTKISVVVMLRPGDTELRSDILSMAGEVITLRNPRIEISSSLIRERLRDGKSIRYLTDDRIVDYIRKKRLYKIE